MSRFSPTREGFRVVSSRPSFALAEIAWRWSVGAASVVLFTFALVEYFDTLPASKLDAELLATHSVPLVWRAIAHIFGGSLSRGALTMLLTLVALSAFWMVAASLGRVAILKALSCANLADQRRAGSFAAFLSVIGLNFLRVVATSAALLAFFSAAIIANTAIASSDTSFRAVLRVFIFLALSAGIAFIWIVLNWLLSFASIFSVRSGSLHDGLVRNGENTIGSISAAISLLSERMGPVLAVSAWNGIAHLTALVCAGSAISALFAFVTILPVRLVALAIVVVALLYFAFVDWLYIARLAGYVSIAEIPEAFSPSPLRPTIPPNENRSIPPLQTVIDREEPILSDLPGLASEPLA